MHGCLYRGVRSLGNGPTSLLDADDAVVPLGRLLLEELPLRVVLLVGEGDAVDLRGRADVEV